MSPVTISPGEAVAAYEEDAFLTVTELGDYIGRDLSADDSASLVIDAATDYCRTIAEQTFTEVSNDTIYLDGTGTDALLLPQLPVTKVRSVKDYGTLVTDWTLSDDGVIFRVSDENSALSWPVGRQRFTVAYDHGFEEVPGDVKMVALQIASRLIIQGVASFESLGQSQVRYAVNPSDLSNGERMILRKYKRSR